MITYFTINAQAALTKSATFADNLVWIDISAPDDEERLSLEEKLDVNLPLHHEVHQLEFSNRFFEKNHVLYLSIQMITRAAPVPESHIVTFILSQNRLITLRYTDPNPIQNFIQQVVDKPQKINNAMEIFLLLLQKAIGINADMFELIDSESDELAISLIGYTEASGQKSQSHEKKLNLILRKINYLQSLLAKSNQSLSSLRLLMVYYQNAQKSFFGDAVNLSTLDQDIQMLSKHGEHLIQQLGFQLQSALGLINIEQTQIIKIFTVLAMVFMPPTLIASIYGMNFHNMPELSLPFAYPIALLVMLSSSLLPYLFFKRKGWI